MTGFWTAWQDVWVNREGTREWNSATVLSAVHPTEGPWCVMLTNRDEMWVHKGHIVGSLAETRAAMERMRSDRATAEPFPAHDFTEDDEPMGEVPDLPPRPVYHRCAVEPIIIDTSTLTQQRTEHVRQNPEAPLVTGVPGDHYTLDKMAYPQEQRREALAQAYGILTESSADFVDVSDAIRLAEYIVSGSDYADTERSIHAEALRTETDAAVDVAVSKLLDTKAA